VSQVRCGGRASATAAAEVERVVESTVRQVYRSRQFGPNVQVCLTLGCGGAVLLSHRFPDAVTSLGLRGMVGISI
jgi:hypothetical protein